MPSAEQDLNLEAGSCNLSPLSYTQGAGLGTERESGHQLRGVTLPPWNRFGFVFVMGIFTWLKPQALFVVVGSCCKAQNRLDREPWKNMDLGLVGNL